MKPIYLNLLRLKELREGWLIDFYKAMTGKKIKYNNRKNGLRKTS